MVALSGDASPVDLGVLSDVLASMPFVVVGVGDADDPLAVLCDVVAAPDDPTLDAVLGRVDRNPIAAATLAVLLRSSESRIIGAGLAAESAAYSTLQAGAEFAVWRAERPFRDHATTPPPVVRVEREDSRLHVTLSRPTVHNAYDRQMRDELFEALTLATHDDSVTEILLDGDGPSFCSGGDLDEFGTRPDPATAHLIRLARSPARLLAALSERVTVRLHGTCAGSGIELPAFAGRVIAHPDTTIRLPEVSMGLIPGAGGTVSLPRRIGRHRTALLALSQAPIDAPTAASWGRIDAID